MSGIPIYDAFLWCLGLLISTLVWMGTNINILILLTIIVCVAVPWFPTSAPPRPTTVAPTVPRPRERPTARMPRVKST